MRMVPWLCLLLILTGFVSLEQVAGQHDLSTKPLAQPAAQSTIAPDLAGSVLLAQWNDEKQLIYPVDPANGEALSGYKPLTGSPAALSIDSQKLAVIESYGQSCEAYAGGTACRDSADVLHLVDLPTWEQDTINLPGQGWSDLAAFNPDNTQLALLYHQPANEQLLLFDVKTGQVEAKHGLKFRPSFLAYTLDGATLILYGSPLGAKPGVSEPGSPRLLLLDAESLEVKWEQLLPGLASGEWCLENCDASHEKRLSVHWQPAVLLSPDRRQLYLVNADRDRLTVLDFETQTVRLVELQLAHSWFEQFLALTAGVAQAKGGVEGATKAAVFSPDGQRLYVVGRTMQAELDSQGYWQIEEASLGLQVFEVKSGRQIAHHDYEVIDLRLTPDGAVLLLLGWAERGGWTEVLDANDLEHLATLVEWEVGIAPRLDGQPLLMASRPGPADTKFAIVDPNSFEIGSAWSKPGYAWWVKGPLW